MDSSSDNYRTTIGDDGYGNVAIAGHDISVVIYQVANRDDVNQRLSIDTSAKPDVGPNPYKSLSSFNELDGEYFFGREEITRKLWVRFREIHEVVSTERGHLARILPIIGPSGCGKSSLARAGLIPELVKRPIPSLQSPRIAVLRPGAHPIDELAAVLARIDEPNDTTPFEKIERFSKELRLKSSDSAYNGLRRIVDLLPEINTRPVVLLIDQLEEVYSICDDDSEREMFVDNIIISSKDRNARLSVIVTLRSDFLPATHRHPELNRIITAHSILVPVMTADELRDAITKPAALRGYRLDPSTVKLLITESFGREGVLPLLQFALTRIWIGITEGKQPAETLQELGGVGGALGYEADQILAQLRKVGKERIVRRAFVKMVRFGEGTQDTRRRARLSEMVAFNESQEDVLDVLRRFSESGRRLVTLSNDKEDITAEITHEQLIDNWPSLRNWIRDTRESERFHNMLGEAADAWRHGSGELWRGANLRRFRDFVDLLQYDMTALENRFWKRSVFAARMRRLFAVVPLALIFVALVAVSAVLLKNSVEATGRTLLGDNPPLANGAANAPPVDLIGPDPDAPLIAVTFSGEGARSAAVGLGVLDELAAHTYPASGTPIALIERVKFVSSVSGGSVVAAWFGLSGPARLSELKENFLVRDNMATLKWEAADPLTWSRLTFGGGYTGIEAVRDLLDRELFHGARFADLRRPGAPLIVMNATDMESGEVFAFTPQRFDDLCSDLDQLPLSVAVAASLAFPVATSPVTLTNYSYEDCKGAIPGGGWVAADLTLPLPRYINLEEYKRARYANALRNGNDAYRNEHYLHLFDGALVDNQGIQSLTEVLVSPHSPARILDAINSGRVRRIAVIAVNARADRDNGVGGNPTRVPGLLTVVNMLIAARIDSTTQASAGLQDLVDTLNAAGASPVRAPGKPLFAGLRAYNIHVDFDQFLAEQRQLQTAVKKIGTSWSLSPTQLQQAIEAGRILLRQHPCFQRLLLDLNARPAPADAATIRKSCPFEGDKTS